MDILGGPPELWPRFGRLFRNPIPRVLILGILGSSQIGFIGSWEGVSGPFGDFLEGFRGPEGGTFGVFWAQIKGLSDLPNG